MLHMHYDRDYQIHGANAHHECRCGARRTRWVSRRIISPVLPGWPPLRDRHGAVVYDSGWQKTLAR